MLRYRVRTTAFGCEYYRYDEEYPTLLVGITPQWLIAHVPNYWRVETRHPDLGRYPPGVILAWLYSQHPRVVEDAGLIIADYDPSQGV